jgi:hypothetical protein
MQAYQHHFALCQRTFAFRGMVASPDSMNCGSLKRDPQPFFGDIRVL